MTHLTKIMVFYKKADYSKMTNCSDSKIRFWRRMKMMKRQSPQSPRLHRLTLAALVGVLPLAAAAQGTVVITGR